MELKKILFHNFIFTGIRELKGNKLNWFKKKRNSNLEINKINDFIKNIFASKNTILNNIKKITDKR